MQRSSAQHSINTKCQKGRWTMRFSAPFLHPLLTEMYQMDESVEDVFIDVEKMPAGSAAVIWYEDGSVTSILPRVNEEDMDDLIEPDSPTHWVSMVMALATEFDDELLSQYRNSTVERMHRLMMFAVEGRVDDWDTPDPTQTEFRGLQIVRDEE